MTRISCFPTIFVIMLLLAFSAYAEVNLTLTTGEVRYFADDVFMLKLDLAINEDAGFYGDVYLVVIDPNGTIYFAPGWQQAPKPVLENFFFPASVDLKSALIIEQDIPNRSFPMLNEGEYIFAIGIAKPKTTDFIKIASVTTKYLGEREWMVINEENGIKNNLNRIIEDRYIVGYWIICDAWKDPEHNLYRYIDGVIKEYNIQIGLAREVVTDMEYDNLNRLWVSSYGLNMYDPTKDAFVNYLPSDGNDPNHKKAMINGMIYDTDDDVLWFASLGGLGRFDIKNESWEYYTEEDGLFYNGLRDVILDSNGNIWVAANNNSQVFGGVAKFDEENFENFTPPKHFKDSLYPYFEKLGIDGEGCVWVGGHWNTSPFRYEGGEWICYGKNAGLPSIEVNGFYLDRFGRFWCATQIKTNTLSQFDNSVWTPMFPEIHKIGMEGCTNIYQDSKNNFWFVGNPQIAIRWGSD